MTSKLDPQELERLSKAATQGVWEISAYYTGTGPDENCHGLVEVEDFPIGIIDEESATAESLSPNLEFVTTLVNAYRTGQLVPAMPSGDVVEAVALAILNSDRGMRGLDPLESREHVPDSDGYVTNATAAITTYEAVSGVAKMREALEWYAEKVHLCRKITSEGQDARRLLDTDGGAFARAALGEKP